MTLACTNCGVLQTDDTACPVCGQDSLEDYTEEESYECDECDDSFDSPQGLAAHERVHDDDDGGGYDDEPEDAE